MPDIDVHITFTVATSNEFLCVEDHCWFEQTITLFLLCVYMGLQSLCLCTLYMYLVCTLPLCSPVVVQRIRTAPSPSEFVLGEGEYVTPCAFCAFCG